MSFKKSTKNMKSNVKKKSFQYKLNGNDKSIRKPTKEERRKQAIIDKYTKDERFAGLIAEMKKYKTFEEYSKKHDDFPGQYWHFTYQDNFKILENVDPRDYSSASANIFDPEKKKEPRKTMRGFGGLMVTASPGQWMTFIKDRPYGAEIDLSEAKEGKDYTLVNRGFGHEIFIHDLDNVKVKRVVPSVLAVVENDKYWKDIPQTRRESKILHDHVHGKNEFVFDENETYSEHVLDAIINDPSVLEDIKLNTKTIFMDIKTTKGSCSLEVWIKNEDFLIEDMECDPEREGVGRKALQIIKQKLKNELDVIAISVVEDSIPFWEKMKKEGLIDRFVEI